MRVSDLESIRIKIASPEDVLAWSHGEVTKPETINYRTQKAEKDGLFCEKIFGPEKDYECYCGKYRRIRYKGIVCDRCGVEVTKATVRRERMGHIKLACPVSHIWFLRGIPSRIGMVLDIPMQQLEKVIYFAAYIVTCLNEDAKNSILAEVEKEFKNKIKNAKGEITDKKELEKTLDELKTVKDKVKEEINGIKFLKVFSEVEYYDYSLRYGEIFEAGTGAETLRNLFSKADLKKEIKELDERIEKVTAMTKRKLLRRMRFLQGMVKANIKPEWMFSTMIPILPPDLRPMVQLGGGRYASSDLNDLYRRVINRNNRLKYLLEISAPEVIVRNEKRMLQEAVDALIDNGMRKGILTTATTGGRRLLKSLADMLKGKQGRFRQNLLGKRVDYSGRSVIVVGSHLKLHQCGLPKIMALELFKPFVIKRILDKELAYNVRGASRLIEDGTDDVWEILEEVVKNKFVLLNRAPTLHRLGIQAFQPVLIEGISIKLHPLVCKAFNADFDGDQMAVHLPLSDKAQKEAEELMLSANNMLKPATGQPVVSPTQDIVLGCYWITQIKEGAKGEGKTFSSKEEAILAQEQGTIDIRTKVKIRLNDQIVETTVGRVLMNETLPEDYEYINDVMTSKKIEKIVSHLIETTNRETVESALDKIKDLGFEAATLSGITWGMDDLIVPPQKKQIIADSEKEIDIIESHYKKGLLSREEKGSKVIEVWTKTKSELEKLVPSILPKMGSIFTMVNSGARGSWSQPVQMAGMKGLVINPAGQIIELPIKSSFKEGFDVLEYFISTHGARKGTADTALRTSTAGYLTRRLVDVAHEVIVHENDCKDKDGFMVYRKDAETLGQDFCYKIVGRTTLEDIKVGGKVLVKKGEIINWEAGRKITGEEKIGKLKVRSALTCKATRGVCQKCYGWDPGKNDLVAKGSAVGIVAAQAIGEPGTQLTMRTFHTGGVAGGSGDITMGLPRVQEIFEARIPKGKAEVSMVDGKVIEITDKRVAIIMPKDAKDKETVEYKLPAKTALLIQKGDNVVRGQQLCEGNMDLKEVFKTRGKEDAERYILDEIQSIYVSQGAVIHDKHVEVIIRQMFSRVKIKEAGDTPFIIGEIVEKSKFLEENAKVKNSPAGEKKRVAKSVIILLGISRVSLTTDSFLSSASFQETSRVLIRAAMEGKVDHLRGLKENVIIGKLIPAGTGFKEK
ncbi:DNA-directed RNA polymerase subunit beta' [Patescibacteria group bacterium]|nr:DNA-directed RNA polymerase subunit beta' [Patescibacteria group bacterium]